MDSLINGKRKKEKKSKRKILYEAYLEKHGKKAESDVTDHEMLTYDEFKPIQYIASCTLVAVRNIIFLIIFLTAIVLAGVGFVSIYYEPTRTILMQLIHK